MGMAKRLDMEEREAHGADAVGPDCAACGGFGTDDVVSRAYRLLYDENRRLRAAAASVLLAFEGWPRATVFEGECESALSQLAEACEPATGTPAPSAKPPTVEERLTRLEREFAQLSNYVTANCA